VIAHQCETSVFGVQAKWHLRNEAKVVVFVVDFVVEIVAVVVCNLAAFDSLLLTANLAVFAPVIVALVV
jgi:hypothetical protein